MPAKSMSAAKSLGASALMSVLLFFPGAISAAPDYDAFEDADVMAVSLPAVALGDALGATYQTGETIVDSAAYNGTLWFRWTPVANGSATPTFTWDPDADGNVNADRYEMVVYRGTTLADLTAVARGNESLPIERFAYQAATTYWVQVHAETNVEVATTFPYTLTIQTAAAAPGAPGNDHFASATTLVFGGTSGNVGTTAGATMQAGESIDSERCRSVWYKFTTATTTSRVFTLFPDDDANEDAYPLAEIFSGSSLTNLVRLGRVETGGSAQVRLPAATYYVRVFNDDTYSPPGGFILEAFTETEPSPDNDNFANATDLDSDLNIPVAGTTFLAAAEAIERLPFAMGMTVWYRWTAPAAGWYQVDAAPAAIGVWSGTTLANLKLRGAADSIDSSVLVFYAGAGEALYFQVGAEGGYSFDFELTVSAGTDPNIPRLTNFSLSASSVNVVSADQDVTATMTLAGPSDGLIHSIYLLFPDGGIADSASDSDLTQTAGTAGNGTFTANLTVPTGCPSGNYPFVVVLTDAVSGGFRTYISTTAITAQSVPGDWRGHQDFPATTGLLAVTGPSNPVPALTSFSVSPLTGDVGTAARTFTVSAVATDAGGVVDATLLWSDPAGVLAGDAVTLALSSGSQTNGTWTGSFTIDQYVPAGKINFTLRLQDTVGQARSFGIQSWRYPLQDNEDGRLQPMPGASPSSVTLTNTVALDLLPPQVSEVVMTPTPAAFGNGGTVDVSVSARVRDSLSGTDVVYWYAPLWVVQPVVLTRVSGDANDGVYTGTVTLLRSEVETGAHPVAFETVDKLGNEGVFYGDVLGMPSLELVPQPGSYDEWVTDNNLFPPDDGPAAKPQADGISNALKFAFNMDPNVPAVGAARYLAPATGTSGLPSITPVGSGATARLRVEFVRRIGAPGLSYFVEFSSGLTATGGGGWTVATITDPPIPIDSRWERVVVEDTVGIGLPHRFGRLRVEVTP